MRRRHDEPDADHGSFWPGVADSLLAALMIIILLTSGGLVLFALNPSSSDQRLRQLQSDLTKARLASEELKAANATLAQENERLRKEPPIIELTDAEMVTFAPGQATISARFSSQLQETVFPQLLRIVGDYTTVDTIEVIGHTDDTSVNIPRSNLDTKLLPVIAGRLSASLLQPGSNADLGLMRAVAVRAAWISWLEARAVALPRKVGVRCYSAANAVPPAIPPGASLVDLAQSARRIEIRFTKLKSSLR